MIRKAVLLFGVTGIAFVAGLAVAETTAQTGREPQFQNGEVKPIAAPSARASAGHHCADWRDNADRRRQRFERDARLADGKGLLALVAPTGSKLWRYRYRIGKIEKKLSIGTYPDLSLKMARQAALEARMAVAKGGDPALDKRKMKIRAEHLAATTFTEVAREYIDQMMVLDGRAEATVVKANYFLDQLAPAIGNRPLASIEPFEVLAPLKRLGAQGKHETAKKCRSFASRVFRYGVATTRCTGDPTALFKGALITPKPKPKPKHHSAILDPRELGGLLRAIDEYTGYPITRYALLIAPHVFVRPGELRHAEWSEIDLEEAVWKIPGHKMKSRRPHAVPLSRQLLGYLQELSAMLGTEGYRASPDEREHPECCLLRTTLRDSRRSRAISLIALPPACSRLIRTTVSTTNIPISPPENPGRCLNHRNGGQKPIPKAVVDPAANSVKCGRSGKSPLGRTGKSPFRITISESGHYRQRTGKHWGVSKRELYLAQGLQAPPLHAIMTETHDGEFHLLSIAILIGNATYQQQNPLECCRRDVEAMAALLEATGRFDRIDAHVDINADKMRGVVREALPAEGGCDEIFFYFSGHGDIQAAEFYYCGTDYDAKSPNLTGVSHSALLDFFRAASPRTLVKVVDACFSGTLLIKGDPLPPPPIHKDGLRNVLQFSSSMDSQTSMGGDPLSTYTREFLEASLRKTEGAVFYTDIANALRDAFIDNDEQTPFFANQGTGREVLVDDAGRLAEFRYQLAREFRAPKDEDLGDESASECCDENCALVVAETQTIKDILEAAEAKMGSPELATTMIAELFNGLVETFDEGEFTEVFEKEVMQHSHYREPTIEGFMIRVLSREKRPDSLVTAELKRKNRTQDLFAVATNSMLLALNQTDDQYIELYNLQLNCSLEKAQLRLTLTPKYRSLQQHILVISCAPSLERLYVFEILTCHLRTDWNRFDDRGEEVVRRWYKLKWGQDLDWLVEQIYSALVNAIQKHIEISIQGHAEE
eukprot:gene19033-19380_t